MQSYVVVYDICSSTVILENLTTNEATSRYGKLVSDVSTAFERLMDFSKPTKCKFLGDGAIYLFKQETNTDALINALCDFVETADLAIHDFVGKHIDIDLPRSGITVGVAFGTIYRTEEVWHSLEYFGRPINFACRLQSSLKEPEQTDKILVQKQVFKSLTDRNLRKRFNLRRRKFRNLNADQIIQCYEIDPYNEDLERNQT